MMQLLPKISVIIPVYNVEKYLRKCLDSLINQTMSELEFICINDGSTDASLDILNEYANKDERFIIVSQENQGQGVARNNGIDLARGECITFVDPDDWIELNTYEYVYKKYKENDVDIVHWNYINYDETKKKLKKRRSFRECALKDLGTVIFDNSVYSWNDIKNKRFASLFLAVWTRLYSTEFIRKNNIRFASNGQGEDHIFAIKATIFAKGVLYVERDFYTYRTRIGSAVNKVSNENFSVFDNINLLKDFLLEQKLFDSLQQEYYDYVVNCLYWHYSCMPVNMLETYLNKCKELFNEEVYKQLEKKIQGKFTYLENIFSLHNTKINGINRKNIRILGFDFLLATNFEEIEQ